MPDPIRTATRARDLNAKAAKLLTKRLDVAQRQFQERAKAAASAMAQAAGKPQDLARSAGSYGRDFLERSILFWDTLRQRGNAFVRHTREGSPPLLHFEYELLLDGRKRERPVNYALVRIKPPKGVTVDPLRRPYLIIDPRAGHGPGIGGFKDDSQVGVALRAGHPVYFVIFYPEPEPGQTLLDVCDTERDFVRHVRSLHPRALRPAIVGNCQGGWAAMMLAAANPDDAGPIVINGAPMSYWGGAWTEGEGDNPMRYSGGLLGGSWLASLTSDLGAGKFDGAWLVQNFEGLNPANTLWDKYYQLYSNVDTEAPRYLEFERWWGGFYLMNREEIEWITQNLFVGNKLWTGGVKSGAGEVLDLRAIRSPIVLFASMGDNITPPQQAFNWVADVYGSTDEIKARGQTIVGLLHESAGHLGIFVSGKVARKEYTQIVEVLGSIEALPPGLYAMKIGERKGKDGAIAYDVSFEERRLEDVVARLNHFERADEKPFEAVRAISEFNQRAYELFARPLVQALANEPAAKLARALHPLRAQRWAISDLNPFTWWLAPAAAWVKANRKPAAGDDPAHQVERAASGLASASLDHYRALRDAASEAAFFLVYGNLFGNFLADREPPQATAASAPVAASVAKARASVAEGGYAEAVARVAALLAQRGKPLPLLGLQKKQALMRDYAELLPNLSSAEARRIRGAQEVIVAHDRDAAIATLPALVSNAADRKRLVTLVQRVLTDPRVNVGNATAEQKRTLERLKRALAPAPRRRATAPGAKQKRRTAR